MLDGTPDERRNEWKISLPVQSVQSRSRRGKKSRLEKENKEKSTQSSTNRRRRRAVVCGSGGPVAGLDAGPAKFGKRQKSTEEARARGKEDENGSWRSCRAGKRIPSTCQAGCQRNKKHQAMGRRFLSSKIFLYRFDFLPSVLSRLKVYRQLTKRTFSFVEDVSRHDE